VKVTIRHNAREVEELFRKAPEIATQEVDGQLDRGALELQREMRRRAPKAQSILTQSIQLRRPRPLRKEIVVGVDYGLPVERGAGPGGSPPRQSLRDWMRTKGVRPRDPRMSDDDLAFVIGRSIRRRGTKAQPFAGPAVDDLRPRLEQLLAQGVANALSRITA
jgi:hypothetical protein